MNTLPDNTHYAGLDALRGIAVLSVALFHCFPTVVWLSWGWMGVDFFFVISGFLITSILLRSNKENHFFKHFYARRILRIIPLCFGILLIFFIFVAFFDSHNRLFFYKQNWWYYFLFQSNWLFFVKGLPNEYYLNHFWSLAIEEQFYVLFPFLIYAVSKQRLVQIILISIPVVLCLRVAVWYFYDADFPKYYCNTFTRIDTILFGCLLGCGFRIKEKQLSIILLLLSLSLLVLGAVLYQSVSFKNPVIATIGFSLIAFINYLFLAYFTKTNQSLTWLRKNKLLNYLGKISYGLYLFHVPVYLIVTALCAKFLENRFADFIAGSISLLFSVLLSSISFYTLELYFLRMKSYFPIYPTKLTTNAIGQKPAPEKFK